MQCWLPSGSGRSPREHFDFAGFLCQSWNANRALEVLTTPDARIAVAAAGTLYFLARPGVDVLGKNDRTLARAPIHPSFRSFSDKYVSGHMKWDYRVLNRRARPASSQNSGAIPKMRLPT